MSCWGLFSPASVWNHSPICLSSFSLFTSVLLPSRFQSSSSSSSHLSRLPSSPVSSEPPLPSSFPLSSSPCCSYYFWCLFSPPSPQFSSTLPSHSLFFSSPSTVFFFVLNLQINSSHRSSQMNKDKKKITYSVCVLLKGNLMNWSICKKTFVSQMAWDVAHKKNMYNIFLTFGLIQWSVKSLLRLSYLIYGSLERPDKKS